MDAPEADLDIKLQKASPELIADFDQALTATLRKPDGRGRTRVPSFVRARETFKSTTEVLDLFQELPQLLDPYLSRWIPLLAESYLEYTQTRHRVAKSSNKPNLVVPVDYAICKILYAFCKVRGEKVIVRFLNVETKYLEVLLSAAEESEEGTSAGPESAWTWEQRYIVLLWLSHMLLAPFDLSTISTLDIEAHSTVFVPGLDCSRRLPGIALRVLPLAIKYLSFAGKESDAAKALLVRLAMRRDMQELGLLDALVRWAMRSLRPRESEPQTSTYHSLGVLSFLAGVLRSSVETSAMDQYLAPIFHCVYDITLGGGDPLSQSIVKLAVVRRMILKVVRSVTVSLLRQPLQSMANQGMVETSIGYLLDSTADNDTPVRLSASKALSVITLRLEPDMACQVVDAVLDSLNRNVLWKESSDGQREKPVREVSAVNHLEWHGLMLTLSHLLYRRSPPAQQLPLIVQALLLGLSFEQRSTSGGSIGSNVRDAACFGLWAIARRYTTAELLNVPVTAISSSSNSYGTAACSILQVLATELVVAACFDPAGNIRRGASAALQELVGRHPDAIHRGIELVQCVDYHAVARRTKAVEEVATKAATLSAQYGEALIDAILGWRGIGDAEAQSRRACAVAFARLSAEMAFSGAKAAAASFASYIELIMRRVRALEKRQVEERHGMLLCFAVLLNQMAESTLMDAKSFEIDSSLRHMVLTYVLEILENCRLTDYRKPELKSESVSQLVISASSFIREVVLGKNPASEPKLPEAYPLPGSQMQSLVASLVRLPKDMHIPTLVADLMRSLRENLPSWLNRNEAEVFEPASAAAMVLLAFSNREDGRSVLQEWVSLVGTKPASRTMRTGRGYFHALAMAQAMVDTFWSQDGNRSMVCQAFLDRWDADNDVDTRVTIFQSITRNGLLQARPNVFLDLLCHGLSDYTTNARGDVGSHVRVQALLAVKTLWGSDGDMSLRQDVLKVSAAKLFPSVLRLSAEKLDRVRPEAQAVVALVMKDSERDAFLAHTFSSKEYFESLLYLISSKTLSNTLNDMIVNHKRLWMGHLMAGFVSSAATGNDDLVIASRAALTKFCQKSPDHLDLVCTSLVRNAQTFHNDDRVVVPTLEIIAFLYRVSLFQLQETKARDLCLYVQKAGYKTGNVRKLVACVKVYGGIAGSSEEGAAAAGVYEAKKRLGALMFHPWPRVRSAVVDEIWAVAGFEEVGGNGGMLTGVDWSAASKEHIASTMQALGMR